MSCDTCIVGAGAAGIYLATRLVASGQSVVLIEAGGKRASDGSVVGFKCEFDIEPYHGATTGRLFGVGGTTAAWGGALMPFTDLDCGLLDNQDIWSHVVMTVGRRSRAVLSALRYPHDGEFSSAASVRLGAAFHALSGSGIDTLSALWLPFHFKNFSFLLAQDFKRPGRLRVVFGGVANAWEFTSSPAEESRVVGVSAVAQNGKLLTLNGTNFVLAAGAIESARILLEMNDNAGGDVVRRTSAVGQYLSDHLSLPIADVAPESLEISRQAGYTPFFLNGWMRNPRFFDASASSDSPRAFAHFIASDRGAGFHLARAALSAFQSRSLPKLTAVQLAAGLGGLLRLGWARYARSELFVPHGTPMHLQLDIEQKPVASNRITLATNRDRYGRRNANISWRIHDHDLTSIRLAARRMLERWPNHAEGVPRLIPRVLEATADKPYDTYHPTGTCRMGVDAAAVVNLDLSVWGTQNLWLLSTGVFPSSGTANPTFSLLCFAEELSEHLLVLKSRTVDSSRL